MRETGKNRKKNQEKILEAAKKIDTSRAEGRNQVLFAKVLDYDKCAQVCPLQQLATQNPK